MLSTFSPRGTHNLSSSKSISATISGTAYSGSGIDTGVFMGFISLGGNDLAL
jgi:hypothetical protein